ncbi:MAG: twin transmembrane helix small protein [Methyloligellaceae bacterium]
MDVIFRSLIPIALAAVAVVLALGLWNMLRGGSPNRSQMLMRWRVILQFVAICIVMAAIYLASLK